jgi:glycosyltransferase involved in cell wall biosynthesis
MPSTPATAMPEPFSLLMSIWAGDRPDFLDLAFVSTVADQTRPPGDVVLVQDGPIGPDLATALLRLRDESPVPVQLVELKANAGLGIALDQGMSACKHDIVARMDADDISLPHRFATQLPLLEAGADLVGSSLLEFGDSADDIVGKRVPPISQDAIVAYSRFHQPFNHPTVVYRRQAVQAVGGYHDLPLMEDYLLFARMIQAGFRVANVAEPLVLYRVGAGAYARRGGAGMLRSELQLQRRLRGMGFTSRGQFLRNIVLRGGYRLVPESVRRSSYRKLIARAGERR